MNKNQIWQRVTLRASWTERTQDCFSHYEPTQNLVEIPSTCYIKHGIRNMFHKFREECILLHNCILFSLSLTKVYLILAAIRDSNHEWGRKVVSLPSGTRLLASSLLCVYILSFCGSLLQKKSFDKRIPVACFLRTISTKRYISLTCTIKRDDQTMACFS